MTSNSDSATPKVPDGFLCINKPEGVTSRDVVNQIQRHVRPTKVGHAGTLDPLATGVLVVALGKATRLIQLVQQMQKRYVGTFELGKTSDTEDITGSITVSPEHSPPSSEDLADSVRSMTGEILQRPPAYSALKVGGRRSYDLARSGQAVELKPRKVVIHSLRVVDYAYPFLKLDVECGSGTYIRSLGRDIGEALGCGAVMTALQRTAIGSFRLDSAVSPEFEDRANLVRFVTPARDGAAQLPFVELDDAEITAIGFGKKISLARAGLSHETDVAALNAAGKLVAVLTKTAGLHRPAVNFVAK